MKNRKVSARFFRRGRLKQHAPLQQLLDIVFYFFRRYAGRKPCHHFALPINQEFGEVPADIARLMLTAATPLLSTYARPYPSAVVPSNKHKAAMRMRR